MSRPVDKELFEEAAELARRAFDPEKLTTGAVVVWDSIVESGESGQARDLVYLLEGWSDEREAWIANDTTNPGECFSLGEIADAEEVKFFTYFLLGTRGGLRPGETIAADHERFARFEAVGGQLGKFSCVGKAPRVSLGASGVP